MILASEEKPTSPPRIIKAWELPERTGEYVFCPSRVVFRQFGELSDLCRAWLDMLYAATLRKRDEDRDEWVAADSRLLMGLLGNRYRSVIAACQEAGLVDEDSRYSPGQRSKKYRLSAALRHHNWGVTKLQDQSLIRRRRKRAIEALGQLPEVYRGPAQFALDLEVLPVPEAFLRRIARAKLEELAPGKLAKIKKDPKVKSAWVKERARMYRNQIDSIRFGMAIPVKDQYGRLHTGLTRLKKELRPYLRYDGAPLASVDIPNSQPVFLARQMLTDLDANVIAFLVRVLEVDPVELCRTLDKAQRQRLAAAVASQCDGETDWVVLLCLQPKTLRTALEGSEAMPESMDADWRDPTTWPQPSRRALEMLGSAETWADLAEKGQLYEALMVAAGVGDEVTRKQFQYSYFFRTLYGPCDHPKAVQTLEGIRKVCPGVLEYLRDVKQLDLLKAKRDRYERRYGKGYWLKYKREFKGMWSKLSREMQGVEADFVFGSWVEELRRRGISCTTIHDELLVTERHQSVAIDALAAEARRNRLRMDVRCEREASGSQKTSRPSETIETADHAECDESAESDRPVKAFECVRT